MADKTFEELLEELELEEEKDTEREPVASKQSETVKQLRDFGKRAAKRAERAEEKLLEYQTKEREAALSGAGLSPRQQTAYLKMYDEVSDTSVAEFKREVLGIQEAPTDPEAPQPTPSTAPAPATFQPTVGGEAPGAKEWEFADWQKLMKEDPVKATALARAGKVKWTYQDPTSLGKLGVDGHVH
jgi:DNA-directed RNA polymerase subunit F